MCNNTGGRVSVALAYTDGQGWVSEGWWNLKSLDCVTLLRGALAAQYYYLYAMDERGGEWKGKAFMCTSDREFKIAGRQDCFVRGFDRTGFFEVDTGDQRAWTVQLTDANEQPAQQRVPGLPGTVGPGGSVPGLPNTPGTAPPPGGSSGPPPGAAPGKKP